MKKRQIESKIYKKMYKWLKTIDDEILREDVKKSLVLSGGAITSMLLGEEVNDYDIYIQDPDILYQLACYYTRQSEPRVCVYKEIIRNELRIITDSGGNIRMKNRTGEYIPILISTNAITLSNKIQLVLRFYGTPEEIHKNYDFIHTTNYFTFSDGLVTNEAALQAILLKELIVNSTKYPISSLLRIRKFIERGWTISAGDMFKLMVVINKLDFKDPVLLKDQLNGVDASFFRYIIKELEEKLIPISADNIIKEMDNIYRRIGHDE